MRLRGTAVGLALSDVADRGAADGRGGASAVEAGRSAMRLLVLCPHFSPDTAPTGLVISAIVGELASRGHEIQVVTALPWYRAHRVEASWQGRLTRRERPGGQSPLLVDRVYPFPTSRSSIPARALGFAGFTSLVTVAAVAARARPDAVLAMSPPITLGLAGWVAARRWRAPLVLNLQDIFPDAAVRVGALNGKRIVALASRLELFVYRRCQAVTVLSEDMRANVQAKLRAASGPPPPRGGGDSNADLRPRARSGALTGSLVRRSPRRATLAARREEQPQVRVIPNFADTRLITPRSRMTSYREEFGLGGRAVVMYAGNVGFSQPLELMVAAARALAHRCDIAFVVNGDGAARSALQDAAQGLDNFRLVGFQPAERLAEVLATADLHVIALREGLAYASVPSKIYSVLAAARPVLAAVDPGTEIARVIASSGCGLSVAPDDEPAFVAAVASLMDDHDRRAEMGRRGRAFAERWMSASAVAASYESLFNEIRTSGRRKRST